MIGSLLSSNGKSYNSYGAIFLGIIYPAIIY